MAKIDTSMATTDGHDVREMSNNCGVIQNDGYVDRDGEPLLVRTNGPRSNHSQTVADAGSGASIARPMIACLVG